MHPLRGRCVSSQLAPKVLLTPTASAGCLPDCPGTDAYQKVVACDARGGANDCSCSAALDELTTSDVGDGLVSHCGVSFPAGSGSLRASAGVCMLISVCRVQQLHCRLLPRKAPLGGTRGTGLDVEEDSMDISVKEAAVMFHIANPADSRPPGFKLHLCRWSSAPMSS